MYRKAAVFLMAALPAAADLTVSYPGSWTGKDWISKQITVTNTSRTPIHLAGIRFQTPDDVWDGSSQADVSTLPDGRVQMILDNLEVNYVGNDVNTFEITGSPNGKDGTPSNTSFLVRNGSHCWPMDIPYSPPVSVKEIDSLKNSADFYSEKLGILDTLGQRGGSMSGGMIDTWYGLTQLQSALPTKPFNQNATWMTFEPKAYGNAMYMMTLAAMQEYFNIDMQMLIAKGGKENMAGMIQWNSLGDTYGEKLGKIYGTGGNGSGSDVDFGPFSVEHQTFRATVIKAHPKFYPLSETASADYYATTKGSTYCDLDKPNVVNAAVICCMYNWYTYQLGLHSTDYGFEKLIREGKDRQGAMKLALWAFNRGTSVPWLDVVSPSNIAQSLTYAKIEDFPKISERTYIDGISAALEPLIESARNSVTLGGTEPVYDDTISLSLVEKFLFGTGGSGSAGTSNEGGLLVHFDLPKEKNKQLWSDVEQAFAKLKGEAPSTKSSPEMISYRYDFLTILRVVKQYIDVSIPLPSNYAFSAWEDKNSAQKVTFSGKTRDDSYPTFTRDLPTGIAVSQTPLVTVNDNGSVRSVEWTADTALAQWNFAFGDGKTSGIVSVDFKAPSPDLVGKKFPYWIRVTDSWGNAEIQKFEGTYMETVSMRESKTVSQRVAVRSQGKVLTVTVPSPSVSLAIYSLRGQLLRRSELSVQNGTVSLNCADLSAGIYTVQISSAGKQYGTSLIRIE